MDYAFSYIRDNGISTEKEYQYIQKTSTCKYTLKKFIVNVTGYISINNNEEELKEAVCKFRDLFVKFNVQSCY